MNSFSSDLQFLKDKDDTLLVLSSENGLSQLIVSAKYQGKVFTSTTNGLEGKSIGFVNRKAFEGLEDEHINVYGGENRFWLGPEGGNFSVFFKKNIEQNFDNWVTPKAIDTEEWKLTYTDTFKASFNKNVVQQNALGTILRMKLDRNIELLSDKEIENCLKIKISDNLKTVAYRTSNQITNKNDFEWNQGTGTVCVWMLDMFPPSDNALTIIPYIDTEETESNYIAKTDYFGVIPSDRIKIRHRNLYLKTDGKFRCKVGLDKLRTASFAGNYNPDNNLLTVISFDVKTNADYLNQQWGVQNEVFNGDVLNAYNDGPLDDGSVLGPFFELESSSPAAFLKSNESMQHQHTVFHFEGDDKELSEITSRLFNVNIEQLKSVF